MKTRFFWGVAAILLLAQESFSETITIGEYLDTVRARHPLFVKEAMQPDIEALARDRFRGNEDWLVQSDPLLNFQKPVVSNTFSPERLAALKLGASVARPFWRNGSRLSLAWESALTDQDLPDITIPTSSGSVAIPVGPGQFFENRLSATFSYPLLQNRGGILDRFDYELSDYNIDFAEIESLENQENFLLDVGLRFIDWVLLVEQARIDDERLKLEQEQLAQIRRKRRANLVDQVDVLRGENAVEIAEENVVFDQARVKAKRTELAVISQDEGIYTMVPDFDLYRLQPLPEVQEAVEKLRSQRIIRSLGVRVEQLHKQKQGLENVTKPRLYVGVAGSLQEGKEDFVDSWALDRPDVTLFVDFRYPLGNRTATADVAKARLQIRQLETQIHSVYLNLEAELRRVWIQARELERVLSLNQQQIETARRKTAEEQRVYNQGRGDLTFVIQSRDNESLAHLRYAANAAMYQKLILSYRALVDELLPTE